MEDIIPVAHIHRPRGGILRFLRSSDDGMMEEYTELIARGLEKDPHIRTQIPDRSQRLSYVGEVAGRKVDWLLSLYDLIVMHDREDQSDVICVEMERQDGAGERYRQFCAALDAQVHRISGYRFETGPCFIERASEN